MHYNLQTRNEIAPHFPLSCAECYHTSSTFPHFSVVFNVTLEQRLGRPNGRDPFTNSEYSSCLASLSSPKRQRWHNQRIQLLTNFISILSTFARLREGLPTHLNCCNSCYRIVDSDKKDICHDTTSCRMEKCIALARLVTCIL